MWNKINSKNPHAHKIITCDNLTISFGKKKEETLIKNFNYSFEKGKVYAIIGNSGSGKTTLVSHLNGILKAKHGNIFIKDKAILSSNKKIKDYKAIRKTVGLVFQFSEYQIFKTKVIDDVAFGPINYNVDKADAIKIASKYINLVGLDSKLFNVNPLNLSNGQKRLVAIAGVLANEPEVLILDEPTVGLDFPHQLKIINIINNLKSQGKTIILVTHNMDNVLELADEVLILHEHMLYEFGDPYSIFTNHNLVNKLNLSTPNVILTINKLINKNPKFKYLLKTKPRNLTQLVLDIKKGCKNV